MNDTTLVDRWLRLENCARFGARFVARTGEARFHPYQEVVARARAAAASLQALGLEPGDRVALILPTSIEFLATFLGVQLAGGIPAALYPPVRLGRLAEYIARTSRMLSRVEARFLVSDRQIRQLLGPAAESVASLERAIDVADLEGGGAWTSVAVDPDTPAFLQFSSGTTVEPKAVMVSHRNAIANLEMIDSYFRRFSDEEAERGGVCWLPLYHDMGLLGCMMLGLHHPGTMTYLGPETFIVRPALWLQTLSRYGAVSSPAPNFAYGLCLNKIRDEDMEGVDLSRWAVALNGAEPVDIDVMLGFCRRFARWGFRAEAMTPVYGLAEAGLAVSFSDPLAPPRVTEFERAALAARGRATPGRGRRLVSVGRAVPGLAIEIRDADHRALGADQVGAIMVKGPSITRGYYNDPELSAATIRGDWLDTGDLGFFHDGELYIAGRRKDLLIIRGRNYAPQEVEELLIGATGVRAGCVVAVSHPVDGRGEQLVILAERDPRTDVPDADIESEIRSRVLEGLALAPDDLRVVPPGTLPRTSSGKLRRHAALEQYLAATLAPPDTVSRLRLAGAVARSWIGWARFRLRRRATPPPSTPSSPPQS